MLDAAVRSWPRVEPLGLRLEHPLLVPDDSIDVGSLKGTRQGRKQLEIEVDSDKKRQAIIDYLTKSGPSTKSRIRDAAGKTKTEALLMDLIEENIVETCEVTTGNNGRKCEGYRLVMTDSGDSVDERVGHHFPMK